MISQPRIYESGKTYADFGSVNRPDDQFLHWINQAGSGIRNMGGIRTLQYLWLEIPVHAWIVLVTDERTSGTDENPWHDEINLRTRELRYWGDAKRDVVRPDIEDFVGNRALSRAWAMVRGGRRELAPPLLHFSKIDKGIMRFNGLCTLRGLSLASFAHAGSVVRNYCADLVVLDAPSVDVEWLRRRCRALELDDLRRDGPPAWLQYIAHGIDRSEA